MKPQLVEEYVATGRVRLEYRDYAFRGEDAIRASVAAACAERQDRFWPYHDRLFQRQSDPAAFAADGLRELAAELGLDAAPFAQCLDDPATLAEIEAMRDEGRALGVDATPSFFVAGQRVDWTDPHADLKAALDAALAAAGTDTGTGDPQAG